MRGPYHLRAFLLAAANLQGTIAQWGGPHGAGGAGFTRTGRPGHFPVPTTTSTTETATETPATVVSYSNPPNPVYSPPAIVHTPPGVSLPPNSFVTPNGPGTFTQPGTLTTQPISATFTQPGTITTQPGSVTFTQPGTITTQPGSVTLNPPGTATTGTPATSSVTSTPNSCGSNTQKISLQNKSGKTLMILAGPPWTVGNCGSIANGVDCTFCQTRGSTGGNLQVGYGASNSLGTWIEGNWDTGDEPTIDISFIPGYSVPISCTSDITGATTGWSTPLCADSSCSNCNSGGGTWDGNSCRNPSGPSNPNAAQYLNECVSFFAASQGGAYCFPNDNGVVGYGAGWSSISCVAGPQYGGSAKRDANDTLSSRDAQEEKPTALETLEARDVDTARRHSGAARLGAYGGMRTHARSLNNLVE